MTLAIYLKRGNPIIPISQICFFVTVVEGELRTLTIGLIEEYAVGCNVDSLCLLVKSEICEIDDPCPLKAEFSSSKVGVLIQRHPGCNKMPTIRCERRSRTYLEQGCWRWSRSLRWLSRSSGSMIYSGVT